MVRRILLFIILGLLTLSTTALHAAELQVQIDPINISINESTTLTVTAIGSIDGEPDLSVLNHDFEIISRSQNSQIQYTNGHLSKSKVWNLTLVPKRIGTITIPPLCSGSDCSDPVKLLVQQQNPNANTAATVMIETEVSTPQVVAQQQLIYTVRLLFRQSLLQAGLGEIKPTGVETTVYSFGEDARYEVDRGNWRYHVVERKFALFPQHAGQLHLPPLRFDGELESNNRSRTNSPFAALRQRGEIVRLRSEAIDITVTEPPKTASSQPWLPAKQIVINDDWQLTTPTLTVGEPATRTIVTTAIGLAGSQLPELTIATPKSFKAYPDKSKREDTLGSAGITGTLEQKVAFVPTQAGDFTLPPLQLKWWDTASNKWETASTKAVIVKVLPAQRTASTSINNDVANHSNQPQPTAPIPPSSSLPADETGSVTNNQGESLWIWISILCASGWLITLVLLFRSRKQQRVKTVKKRAKSDSIITSISKARGELIRCAQSNDPVQTHTALDVWIKLVAPNTDPETFIKQLDLPLQQHISVLNSVLYSAKGTQPWAGEELAQALKDWSADGDKQKTPVLPDFYPPDCGGGTLLL